MMRALRGSTEWCAKNLESVLTGYINRGRGYRDFDLSVVAAVSVSITDSQNALFY